MKEKNTDNMNLFRYNDFINRPINENLDRSRKFLKERELIKLAAQDLNLINKDLQYDLKSGEKKVLSLTDFSEEDQTKIKAKIREINLDQDQLRKLEQDPDFIKIRELLKDNLGYLYNFVYMFFVEKTPFNEIEDMYKRCIENKQILDKMAEFPNIGKKFDANFIDPTLPIDGRNNSEILLDALNLLDDSKKIKKVIDKLTPVLKKSYNSAPDVIKEQFDQVAMEFNKLGKGNEEKKEKLWKSFFGEVRTIEADQIIQGKEYKKGDKRYFGPLSRYTTIVQFIKAAQDFLKSSESDTAMEFLNTINECNDKYGTLGADIVFIENNILILEIKSFQANQYLNGDTRHCIKDSEHQWKSYVSNHDNKQYYIYNFNIPKYNNLSIIGITIEPKQKIRAAHAKDDSNILSTIKNILKNWEKEYNIKEDLFSYLKPISDEEVERRKRSRVAERKIIEKGISIEQIKEYVTVYGANINNDNAKALTNAVEEDDIEKVKYILSLGANPNLGNIENIPITKAKNLNMIKLLVSNGSEMAPNVFKNIVSDAEAVEYCLKSGMDPNFTKCMPLRATFNGTYKNNDDIGKPYYESFLVLLKYGANLYDPETGKNMVLRWAADKGRVEIMKKLDEHVNGKFTKKEWLEALNWIKPSRMNEKDKSKVISYLEEKVAESQD